MKAIILISKSFLLIFVSIFIFACLSEVEAQDQSMQMQPYPTIMQSSSVNNYDTAQYSQYYSMSTTGSVSSVHIVPPQKYDLAGNYPTTVYMSSQQQAIPYSQYMTYATYPSNSIWIQGSTSWTQYASVPQGANLALLAISSTGGNGYLYEIGPTDQVTIDANYFYPGYSQIRFYAETIGQYILLFTIDNQASNAIVINVVPYYGPTYSQSSGYQQPTGGQSTNYGQPSYPSQGA